MAPGSSAGVGAGLVGHSVRNCDKFGCITPATSENLTPQKVEESTSEIEVILSLGDYDNSP